MKLYVKLILSFAVNVGLLFSVHSLANAAVWPGNQWDSNPSSPNSDIIISLGQQSYHQSAQGTKVKFYYYVKDDQGPKNIRLINTECGNKDGVIVYIINEENNFISLFGKDNCGNKDLNLTNRKDFIQFNDGVYARYEVAVYLWGTSKNDIPPNIGFFKFQVQYDASGGNAIGFKSSKSKSDDYALPLGSRKGDTYLNNIRIPIGSCDSNGTGRFNIYDSDNFAGGAQPDNPYTELKFGVRYDGALIDHVANGVDSNVAWFKQNGYYYPKDSGSSQDRWIEYSLPRLSDGDQAYFILKDLGGNNFVNFGIPWDELPKSCPPIIIPKPNTTPPTNYNWAINATSSVNNSVITKGSTALFKHKQLKATGSNGWVSDNITTDYVNGDIVTTFNGNEIARDTGFDTNTGETIEYNDSDAPKPTNRNKALIGSSVGRYCQYINYPVGFLGKRKAPNYNGSGHTYRWVYIPGRTVDIPYDITKANRNMSVPGGGYDAWWLGSTTDDTPNGATDQYWSFHDFNGGGGEQLDANGANNWRWESKAIDNNDSSRRPWEVYGWWNPFNNTYNSFPYSFTPACVDVIDPTPTTSVSDFEKGSGDKRVTHNVNIGPNCLSAIVDIRIRAYSNTDSFYDETFPVSLGGGQPCSRDFPKDIPQNTLNNYKPGEKVSINTEIVSSDRNDPKSFVVYEVPFARFYGNDIYSRTNINFNTVSTDIKKGSIVEYAAMAGGYPSIGTGVFIYPSNNQLKAVHSNIPEPTSFILPSVCSDVAITNLSTIAGKSCFSLNNDLTFSANTSYTQKISIASTEDVFINADITNDTANANYSSPELTGVLLIKAKNIYIGPNVKRIDAILFASESVVTCATDVNGSTPAKNNWHKLPADGGCRNPLTINGAIESANIKFSRTGGSRLLNNGSKNGSDTVYNIGARNDAGYASGEPAEIVNFPVYLYFARPYVEDLSSTTFGSIYDAPPRR
jgi:hypothetical protein